MIEEEDDFESTDGEAAPLAPAGDRRYAGVRALWMKVIIRAVFDWVTYRDSTKLDKMKYAESAYNWLFKKSLLFNSFENVCKLLDIDPEKVRHNASRMTKDDVAKIEHLERDYDIEEKPVLKKPKLAYRRLASDLGISHLVERVSNGVF